MISSSGGVALVIHFSNETPVSPNLTLVIRLSNENFHYQSVSSRWYALLTMISNSAGFALVIHFSNETAVSPNLTLVIRFGNENSVSSNLSLVIRSGDTVIRILFSKFSNGS